MKEPNSQGGLIRDFNKHSSRGVCMCAVQMRQSTRPLPPSKTSALLTQPLAYLSLLEDPSQNATKSSHHVKGLHTNATVFCLEGSLMDAEVPHTLDIAGLYTTM